MYEAGPDGTPRVTGLRLANGGKGEKVVTADAYVAALVGSAPYCQAVQSAAQCGGVCLGAA